MWWSRRVHRTRRKKVKKSYTPKATTFGLDVWVNSHVTATIVVIITTKTFFFYFFFIEIFVHSCVRTAVDFSHLRNFRPTLFSSIYTHAFTFCTSSIFYFEWICTHACRKGSNLLWSLVYKKKWCVYVCTYVVQLTSSLIILILELAKKKSNKKTS